MMCKKVIVVTSCLALLALFVGSALAISSRPLITATGAAMFDQLGFSVSGAGDVNGDGYPDVIVGTNATPGGTGHAYVYYGGPGADAIADLTLTGEAVGDAFGNAVSAAGDVNGDGYADVIVGAPGAGPAGEGRAYVYYGGSSANATADLTLTGAAATDLFGFSVSGAGDVNGDGYADVIVGAQGNDVGGASAGRAYVYYGGPGADTIADLTLTGAAAGDLLGFSVSEAGDVNGDDSADVIVGASSNDAGGVDAGRAYVYYGGPGVDATADLTLTGEAAGDGFGNAVSAAGDVNGDGHADVIVGANLNDAGGASAGRAYVYYGGPGADATADLTLTGGAAAGNSFGFSVSGAGDVNGDGFADVIAGALGSRASIYFGGPGANAIADLTLVGETAGDIFGRSVSAAGDVNGDGYGDVIVGANSNDAAAFNAGRAYVIAIYPYEVLAPNGGEQWVAGHPMTVRWLGHDPADLAISYDGGSTWSTVVSGVGGLEENEFTLTAPGPATDLAKVRVTYSGLASTRSNSDASDGVFSIVVAHDPPEAAARLQFAPTGAAVGDALGFGISSAGDVNGDGFDDVIVGAHDNDAAGANAGRAYIYFGGPGADAVADVTLTGEAAADRFGLSVSSAGDMNGDGYGDVVVGAFTNDAGGADAGRAYIYLGGASPDAIPDLTLTGAAAGDEFGRSVSTAGDVNGDGFGDVIVGAELNDAGGATAGRAYVYFGGRSLNSVADLVLTGVAASDQFGRDVSTAGDVNMDGFDDVIVGTPFGLDDGRADVFYGGPSGDTVADLTLRGDPAGGSFGFSVSTAGDVNSDGYDDMIVGAAGDAGAGRAYIYFGGGSPDIIADLTLTGEATADAFGFSVSFAGDVNADEFDDVIVGAYSNGAGGLQAGRAYVFYGGASPNAIADLTLTGEAALDGFGSSVSSAGDVNGDGFDDVIVGADDNDAGGGTAGRAYVYDMNRYHLLSPIGGETWNVGALKSISWLGAEPADLWLSADGGNTYQLQLSRVGGAGTNSVQLRVPHLPTKFARVRVTPSDASIGGRDQSDSTFTIQTSVALLALLAAPAPDRASGAVISWKTDPGPEDLAGYRLERAAGSEAAWRTVASLTRETSVTDPDGGPGSRYRLFAINGLGEELWLGETSLPPAAPLAAWPLPYRGGSLSISFATFGGLGGGAGRTEVAIFDVSGRLVRTIVRAALPAGHQSAVWDGRDDRGHEVSTGIYFLRALSASGDRRSVKIAVLR